MKKKVLCFILALFMTLGMIPMTLLTAFAQTVADLVEPTPKISIVPVDVQEGDDVFAKPDAFGYAHFMIKVDPAPKGVITVHYKTSDLSAVAASGDYVAESESVVLTPQSPEKRIMVKTARTEYAMLVTNYEDTWYWSRTFEVSITGAEGNKGNFEIDSKKSSAKCALNGEHTYKAYYNPYEDYTHAVLSAYVNRYTLYDFFVTPAIADDETYRKTAELNFPSEWKSAYVDSALDAKLYVGLGYAHIDESAWNSSTSIVSEFLGIHMQMKGEFHDNEWFGWGSACMYEHLRDPGKNGEHEEAYKDNFEYMSWRTYTGEFMQLNFKLGSEMSSLAPKLEGKHIILRDNSRNDIYYHGIDPSSYYIALQDKVLDEKTVSLRFSSLGGYARRLTKGDLSFLLNDITAPTLEKEGNAYAVYHNFDTVKEGEKLRVAFRFNEPVQIDGKTPYVVGKVNGKGTGAATDPYYIRFDYVGGSGTDTLYFEGEYSKNDLITSITDVTFVNGDSIVDFGYECNPINVEKFTIGGFTLDRRDPVINVENSDFSNTAEPIRSVSIPVTVAQITNGATLYYTWTDSETTPNSYDGEILLNDVSIYETQTVNVSGGGDGAKYLHLKVVTAFGKSTIRVCNSKTGIGKDFLGAYYFDNSAPTFGVTLSPTDGSDMSKKVYMIPLPVDNPNGVCAGFYEMKIYYVKPGGKAEAIKREDILLPHGNSTHDVDAIIARDFTTEIEGRKYLPITIEAADVGVGEKTRAEDVEIYFVLTDALGNTATGVSSHKTTFDTNAYINVVTPGYSSPSFIQKTERVDGNTMIYSNDMSVIGDGKTVYYSFEVKIREEASSCTNIFSVVKVGDASAASRYEPRTVIDTETGVKTLILEFTSPLENGCYDIQLLCYDEGTLLTEKADRVTDTYRVYVGNGVGALGNKINAGTVLINKVYQLPASSNFYYMARPSGTSNVQIVDSVLTEYYNAEKLPMSFSSAEQARKYVLFNEYRDLYTVTLTEALADALNSKTTGAQPAQGETTEARAGQVWIRYKSISWTLGSKQTSNWVYYYYGSTDVLNPDHFSPILNEALNYVADVITKSGKTVALTDLSLKNGSGTTLLDQYGAPYLAPTQIVSSDRSLTESATPISKFSKEIRYTADTAIFSSTVVRTVGGVAKEYALIGNVAVPVGSRFQYRRYDSIASGYISEVWTDLVLPSSAGTLRFADVIVEGGWYEIRELGVDGTSLFDVYIDKTAPSLCVSWKDKNGAVQSQWLSAESQREFRAGSFELTSIDNLEADKYSYVAVYNMITSELCGVYTVTELQRAVVTLEDGKYYIVLADRSGNSYWMSIYINSSNMNCDIEETENVRIKFTCDRDPSQIQSFYVKRNGVRVENVQYATTLTFTESGTYEFYVEDIYGNAFGPITYEFTRDYPEVTWSYQASDGSFVKYDPNVDGTNRFALEKQSDGSYQIISSVQVRFQMEGDYVYEFIGAAPDVTKNNVYHYVTINSVQSFQLKISYRDHPDVYTMYCCSADQIAPQINVSAQVYELAPAELEMLKNAITAGEQIGTPGSILEDGVPVTGNFLRPSTIAYLAGKAQTKYLMSGDSVLSDFISVSARDENGLSSLQIYLGGELIYEQTHKTGFSDTVLSRYGQYRIVAKDLFGNVSEFSFYNESPDCFQYRVDGNLIPLGLHDYQNFDQDLNYTAANYGNASVSFTILERMSVFYLITDTNGEQRFAAFDVNGGVVRALHYFLRDGSTAPELVTGDVLFNAGGANASGAEYPIYEANGIVIFAKSASGGVELKVYSKPDGVIAVDARLSTAGGEFYYNRTELSRLSFDLDFKVGDDLKEPETPDGQINLNKPFEIVTDDSTVAVEVYYSNLNDLDKDHLSGKENLYGQESYGNEGFYFVRARDKYGNERVYRIHLSDDFDVTSYVEFSDGPKVHYSSAYEKELYSDAKIVFELHANDVSVLVKKNGSDYLPVVLSEEGVTRVILTETGTYTLKLSDKYGNTKNCVAQIDKTPLTFNEDLLTGYNENAIRKDEGYTNQKLSVSEDALAALSYLAVRYGENLTVIYDALGESTVGFDRNALYALIGNDGDGEYTVIVRNRYGAIATKTVHYRATPTLKLERETRSSLKPEAYDLANAQAVGFWSNNTLSFTTDASVYVFTVNGDKTECPKTIFYGNSGQYGRSEYDITYVDEYGFTYSFKAYLVRQDLEISASPEVTTLNINDLLTTKDNVSVVFSEGAFCTYTLNNSEAKPYAPGQKLTADGVYRFTVSDYAGNIAALTLKKDTVVEFYFKSNTSSSLQNGEAVNHSKVEFNAKNDDTAYIERVLKDGVVQKDFNTSTFAEDGKWEVIIADKLGNRSYFSFYIITHAQNGFAYTTPYEYHITELWYEGADGVKISYMNFVDHTDSVSSFDFTENGKYTVTMMSDVTGVISAFEFTVNTNAPNVHLVGCNVGETTINDVTISGCTEGDRIKIYKITETGEKLVKEVEVASSTQLPTISEGGEYRVVVESEAGVATELHFTRKHVMNTAGSVLIMVLVGVAAVGLFAGLVYRNKSKTDD